MATNYFKDAYDKVKEIIVADSNFRRLSDKRRLFLRDELRAKDFAFEDGIMLRPTVDQLLMPRVPGREDRLELELVYFKKQEPEINFDELTAVADNLIQVWRNNLNVNGEWHYITAEGIEYSIDLPPELAEKNYFGFTMLVVILKGKYD